MILSNEDFGARIGVGHSMASRIRGGQRLPGTRTLHAIHREFGIPLEDLLEAHARGRVAFGELIRQRLAQV